MISGKITTDDGCCLAWRADGPVDAPPLLLSNSLGTSMAMWDAQIEALSSHFRVIRYDSRGHGQSDAPAGAYSMDRLGRDAVALLDRLGIEKTHFCGLSKGGMVGQWLAARAPDRVERLVLANTSAYMGPPEAWQSRINAVLSDGMEWLAEASIGRWFTPAFVEREPERIEPIRKMLLATNPVGYAGCCAAIRDMDLRPFAICNQLPTLVIAGSQDPATPLEHSAFLVDRAANARLEIVPAAHLSNVEAPEVFASLVLGFLRQPV
jgi:3-oxoadipate enol-lactonase